MQQVSKSLRKKKKISFTWNFSIAKKSIITRISVFRIYKKVKKLVLLLATSMPVFATKEEVVEITETVETIWGIEDGEDGEYLKINLEWVLYI